MMSSAKTPRLEQIDALTRGKQLPLPEIDPAILEIIAECLRFAYREIVKNSATVISCDEAEITALLETEINEQIGQDIFLTQLVMNAVRGKESISFDGSHIEKRPDISIYLTGRERNFPLIVEAKILDAKTDKTIKMYCENGLHRFLVGDYAWASQEAFMLAYVRDSSTIHGKLTPLLCKETKRYAVQALPVTTNDCSSLAQSQHARAFTYPTKIPSQNVPGSITVWHLWLP